jgi:DNA-binding CsgD family transcriptional regulator
MYLTMKMAAGSVNTHFGVSPGPSGERHMERFARPNYRPREHRSGTNAPSLGHPQLTPREGQVLIWVARGKSNSEIAYILRLSGRTVQKHLEHIFQKLGVENRTAAAVKGFWMMQRTSL